MAWFVHAMPVWTSSIDHLWLEFSLHFTTLEKRQRLGVGHAVDSRMIVGSEFILIFYAFYNALIL